MPSGTPKKKESLERAEKHLKDIEDRIAAGENGPTMLKERRMAIGAISRLKGETQRINERTILKSPAWRRIQKAIIDALIEEPAAAKRVIKALQTLEARED